MENLTINYNTPSSILIATSKVGNQIKIAADLISKILETEILDLKTFYDPDLIVVYPNKSLIQGIGIDDIHSLISKIKFKTYQRKYKVALILNADKMTQEAQNSLLKTLEEPPKDTFIILTCSHKDNLLPTIISRTKVFEFYEKEDLLEKNKIEKFISLDFAEKCEVVDKLVMIKDKFDRRSKIEELIKLLLEYYREKLLKSEDNNKKEILKSIELIEKIKRGIVANVNLKLSLLNLIVNLTSN